MEKLFNQMGEFITMETEIPFNEFQTYYDEVVAFLNAEFQTLTQEDLIKMSGITQIVGLNGKNRATRKDQFAKKYNKISSKCNFWTDAINFKLKKEFAMDDESIEEAVDALWED